MSALSNEKAVPVLYLDLDGTVRQGKDDALGRFVNGPEDVVVFPEAVEMMRRWKARGGRIAAVSNQGGIALGIVSLDQVADAMLETQRQCGGLLDLVTWCRHHPNAADPEMARCWCRKPLPGAVIEAAYGLADRYPGEIYPPHLALFVGDRPEDEQCARNAGLDFQWAAEWRAQAAQAVTSCRGTDPEPGLIPLPGLEPGRLRSVRRDGAIIWQLRCPLCHQWADIDDDQLHGRVSIDHTDTGCGFHETHDLYSLMAP